MSGLGHATTVPIDGAGLGMVLVILFPDLLPLSFRCLFLKPPFCLFVLSVRFLLRVYLQTLLLVLIVFLKHLSHHPYTLLLRIIAVLRGGVACPCVMWS